MNNTNNKRKGSFPDPLADTEVKKSKDYGIKYAKAIEPAISLIAIMSDSPST